MKQWKRGQLELEKIDLCAYWAEPISFIVYAERTIQEWANLVEATVQPIVVIDEQAEPIGTLSEKKVLRIIGNMDSRQSVMPKRWLESIQFTEKETPIHAIQFHEAVLILVKDGENITGAITRDRWRYANERLLQTDEQQAVILKTVLETAYEGIVIVDQYGKIASMNNAYLSFLGRENEDEVVGKFVADVIDNTELHHVVKSGVPQRGKIQVIQGQKMVVHRMPIWKKRQIVGAIGMLIFEGVSELYRILKDGNDPFVYSVEGIEVVDNQTNTYSFEQMIGKSTALQTCKSFARKASRTKATVLITGESGTGKELFARSIHRLSSQAEGPFVAVNCAALPESLLEAELFGYEEGSFTGAKKGGFRGKFEQAEGGTLFLDEAGEMSASMQAKLLRALELKEVTRIGGSQAKQVHFRLIAATNHQLKELVRAGVFREDLYYRINVIPLQLPSLRERIEDLPILISHYIETFAREYQMETKEFGKEAMQVMLSYQWPGNVRELVNVIDYVMTMSDSRTVSVKDLPEFISVRKDTAQNTTLKMTSDDREKKKIKEALLQANGNKTAAATMLGVHRATLYRKIKSLGLDVEPL